MGGTDRKEMSFPIGIYRNPTLQLNSVVVKCPIMKPSTRVDRAFSERQAIEAYPGASRVLYWSGNNETVIFEKSIRISFEKYR